MTPLCFAELKKINLEKIAVSGLLPAHYLSANPMADLRGYVDDYLKEEVAAEALTRHPRSFPLLYVGLVRAGEAGGQLAKALDRLAGLLEHQPTTRGTSYQCTGIDSSAFISAEATFEPLTFDREAAHVARAYGRSNASGQQLRSESSQISSRRSPHRRDRGIGRSAVVHPESW